MKTQIMLDLETLGNKPGCIIVAIGAVKFGNGEIISSFYDRIDPESCEKIGLKIDSSTVMWWLKQSDEARLEITKEGRPIEESLSLFNLWIGAEDVDVWGNGAAFDNAIISSAYDHCEMGKPWNFWNDKCYRTVKGLYPNIPLKRIGTHHNALNDAESQARHLMEMIKL